MPLGSLDRTPPAFFHQGPSAVSKLLFFSAFSVLLMVADVRFGVTQPIRASLSVALYPFQWLARQPQALAASSAAYFQKRDEAQLAALRAQEALLAQSQRALQVDQLALENTQLRALVSLSERAQPQGSVAQVLYSAADPYTRKVILDKGAMAGIKAGAPVMDERGILGQVTQVLPWMSEVTLITDREQAVPVLNTRTGGRGVVYGESGGAPLLELRFMATNADVEEGDLLTTSGVDGIYPLGIPVGKVIQVERRAETVFARILCEPVGHVQGARLVMVLAVDEAAQRPKFEKPTPVDARKRGR